MQGFGPLEFCDQGWAVRPVEQQRPGGGPGVPASGASGTAVRVELKGASSGPGPPLCLSAAGAEVPPAIDPWCIENNNMWRSQTDVLQCWPRSMIEVESMSTQGTLSGPGAWSFPDCLELGVRSMY